MYICYIDLSQKISPYTPKARLKQFMTAWSKYNFDLAATQVAFLLCYDNQSDNINNTWSYEHDCLSTVITREITKQITGNDHQIIQLIEDVTSLDGDSIVFRDVQKSYWFVTISYSDIWQVPVLHFVAQMQDGTPLSRDDVISSLLEYSDDDLDSTNVISDFVSIDEHPVTGIPSYFLHPCRTSGLLEILCNTSSDSPTLQLWSWMSMILPHVGLIIHPSTFRRIQAELGG